MQAIRPIVKQTYHILSGRTAQAAEQVLSIRIGDSHFGFAITSLDAAELYQLAWFTDAEITDTALRDIYQKNPALAGAFKKTIVCFDYAESVMAPFNLYKEADTKLLLETMFGVRDNNVITTETVEGWQINNVYTVPQAIQNWVNEKFQQAYYKHTYTVGIRQADTSDFEGAFAVDFRNDNFSVLVTKGNKLLLAQTFEYATPADVVYHLINISQKFSLKQETVLITIAGLIEKESALFREVYQYFLHVNFREASWHIADDKEEYPKHFFTSLNDLAKCAL